jgi:Fic family protein
MKTMMYTPPNLPLELDIETKAVMKRTALARSALAEMKGSALSIPNETILISTLSLQEAKDSSAIENIITTHDELFQVDYLKRQADFIADDKAHRWYKGNHAESQTQDKKGFT